MPGSVMPSHLPEAPFATTDDAVLGGRLRLLQPERGHRAGHDAILLAAAAPKARHAVDLGAGVGTAGLALLARGVAERVTLVEIDAGLAALARQNAERNGFGAQVNVVCADATTVTREQIGVADLVIMNPPFNDPAGRQPSPDAGRRRAHVASDADLAKWIAAAGRLLDTDGELVLIHRADARDIILAALDDFAVELIPILPRPVAAAIRLIARARKGRRAPLRLLAEFVLAGAEGPSAAAEAVLRQAAPLHGPR
jgi:tRNA1(Val) A37 N6-methylase TrmN6